MTKIQNVSDHAVDLHAGALGPGETAEVESTRGLGPLIDAGLLVELDEKPEKGKDK